MEAPKQTTSRPGRLDQGAPLIWMTVEKSSLEGRRNDHEYRLIERLHGCLSPDVTIIMLRIAALVTRNCIACCRRSAGISSFAFAG